MRSPNHKEAELDKKFMRWLEAAAMADHFGKRAAGYKKQLMSALKEYPDPTVPNPADTAKAALRQSRAGQSDRPRPPRKSAPRS